MSSNDEQQVQHERPPFEYKRPPPGCVAFLTIPATDEARAQKFYEHVFSWNFWTGRGVTVFFTNGGEVMGRIVVVDKVAGENDGATSLRVFTHVPDVADAMKKVVEAGGEIVKDTWLEGDHTWLGIYKDTEGNVGGVLKWNM